MYKIFIYGTDAAEPSSRTSTAVDLAKSVVDCRVGGCPEVEQDRQPGRRGRPLDHEDCRQVLGGVVVPAGAVNAGPSVTAGRGQRRVRDCPGSEVRARTPAETRRLPSAPASGGRWSSASPSAARALARRGGYLRPAEPVSWSASWSTSCCITARSQVGTQSARFDIMVSEHDEAGSRLRKTER